MNITARLAAAGDRFLDTLVGNLDIYSSRDKLMAARIIAAVLWLLVCYAFIYFFVASLPITWDGSIGNYIGAGVFTLIFVNCLVILVALVVSALQTYKIDRGRLNP